MPGENCAVFGCGTCRKVKGIGIWKVPAAKDVSTQEPLQNKPGIFWLFPEFFLEYDRKDF